MRTYFVSVFIGVALLVTGFAWGQFEAVVTDSNGHWCVHFNDMVACDEQTHADLLSSVDEIRELRAGLTMELR